MEKITCTFSGLRPHKLPEQLNQDKLLTTIEQTIRQSISDGYTVFLSGMAMGVDIWASRAVIKLKEEYPQLRLICYQPCETQANNWPETWRESYFNTLAQSDDVICLQWHYSAGCMQRRNIQMIDRSSRLIAVHDGATGGGTAHTIQYAKKRGLDIITIHPLTLQGPSDLQAAP